MHLVWINISFSLIQHFTVAMHLEWSLVRSLMIRFQRPAHFMIVAGSPVRHVWTTRTTLGRLLRTATRNTYRWASHTLELIGAFDIPATFHLYNFLANKMFNLLQKKRGDGSVICLIGIIHKLLKAQIYIISSVLHNLLNDFNEAYFNVRP